MPHSLVLNLIPATPIQPEFLNGRHLHALFLTIVSSVDRELGDRLHAQKTEKAFTLSPLQLSRGYKTAIGDRKNPKAPILKRSPEASKTSHTLQYEFREAIPAESPIWWRISLLDDSLFSDLTQLWLNLNPDRAWHLGAANLYITSVLGTPQSIQPWANYVTYNRLYEAASETKTNIQLSFCTPTVFRKGDYDNPLPDRDSVFSSILKRWNTYSGREFSKDLLEYIFPSQFQIRTEVLRNYGSSFIGCLGEVQYSILGDVDPTIVKQINTLADFALFAGVGRKTTMGMGMVRRV